MNVDIGIVGAGPAGLMAAIVAARAGAQAALIERNSTAGRKLLKTGGGRCNITHAAEAPEFLRACAPYDRFLRHAIHELSPEALCGFFAEHNLQMKTEKDGCVFPLTDRASDVLRILVDLVRRLRVHFLYGRRVLEVTEYGSQFKIRTDNETVQAKAVIIATGGRSWSFTGSTGDGYELARSFGHTVITPKAAVCPIVVAEPWVQKMQGTAIPDVVIRVKAGSQTVRGRGALMFTESGLGGPVIFNFSRQITDYCFTAGSRLEIFIDFAPEYEAGEFEQWLMARCTADPRKELAGLLSDRLVRKLSIQLEMLVTEGKPILAGHFTRDQRKQLLTLIKAMPLHVTGMAPLEKATITRGGVCHQEIHSKTMESKFVPGLFFAGEVIDADGPCGGYNLQIAWATGALAGQSAAEHIRNPQSGLDKPK